MGLKVTPTFAIKILTDAWSLTMLLGSTSMREHWIDFCVVFLRSHVLQGLRIYFFTTRSKLRLSISVCIKTDKLYVYLVRTSN